MKANFDILINDSRPVIVDFHAEWCSPCKAQSPILKDIASELGNKARVIKIDVDKNPEIAARYHIQGVPTIVVFKQGTLRYRQAGMHSKQQLMTVINNLP
ncbi:MAG: thioredoxin [Bacteroidales bacterium]|nr:thioredoxin [Bacteroidales bacterium]